MATSNNPLAPDPMAEVDSPKGLVPLDDGDRETLEYTGDEPAIEPEEYPEDGPLDNVRSSRG